MDLLPKILNCNRVNNWLLDRVYSISFLYRDLIIVESSSSSSTTLTRIKKSLFIILSMLKLQCYIGDTLFFNFVFFGWKSETYIFHPVSFSKQINTYIWFKKKIMLVKINSNGKWYRPLYAHCSVHIRSSWLQDYWPRHL